ncbi:MAG: hypothetical protein AB8H80_19895 [Planctomycetota bacterium]
MKQALHTLLLGAGFGAAFLLGQVFSGSSNGDAQAGGSRLAPAMATLDAQGRSPIAPPPPSDPVPGSIEQPVEQPIVYTEESGAGAAANGFVAVTGSYGVGTSVLYLIDTKSRQLAVYEARGGSAEQRRIVLVGARRIDLDLQLHGYNDRSEFEYEDLEKLFTKRGRKDHSVRTGLESDSPAARRRR